MRSGYRIPVIMIVLAGCNPAPQPEPDCAQPAHAVRIVRDEAGVPHVFAQTLLEAAYGQGYAQASDRLLQIDLMRRVARGRRAELLGESALEMDRLVRAINLEQAARSAMTTLSDESMCTVRAYVAGVNQFLTDMDRGERGARRPADLDALDPAYVPPPWEPLDVIAVATAAVFSLSSQLEGDLVLTAFRQLAGDEDFARYVHFAPLTGAYTLTDPAADGPIAPVTGAAVASAPGQRLQSTPLRYRAAQALAQWASTWQALRRELPPSASNNWVVHKDVTHGGAAFMASDPHGSVTLASSFHEIHLIVAEPALNAYGIAVAGTPMVQIGHNGNAAWSFTNLGADVGDLYEETLNDDETAVLRDGREIALVDRTERIRVRREGQSIADADEIALELQDVPGHGPILNPVLPDPLPLLFANRTISYRWVGYEPNPTAQALANLTQVLDWSSFVANASEWQVGGQNTVFAGVSGDIGYRATSLLPGRPWIEQFSPIEPLPGDGSAEWVMWDERRDIRELYNPSWGFIGTANGDPRGLSVGDTVHDSDYLGWVLDMGYRTHRIKSVLHAAAQTRSVDWATMESLQTDVYVGAADSYLPRLYAALAAHAAEATGATLGPMVDVLQQWDRRATADSAGSAIFHQWLVRMITDYLAPPLLEPLRPLFLGNNGLALRALAAAISSADPVIFPDGVDAAMMAALRTVHADLGAFFGTADVAQWRWGSMHLRSLEHPLGSLGHPEFNRGPLPSQGGLASVNRSDFQYLNAEGIAGPPYKIVDGPDMRFLVELKEGEWRTRIRMPAGSSGDPVSPHYSDQFADWVAGNYRTAHYLPQDVEAAAVAQLSLPAAR